MNVFPPLTGRLMYYASPPPPTPHPQTLSDQRGWRSMGRGGAPMSDAPWHWLYKWMHLHAFHFAASRVMGGANRAIVNRRWLTSAGAVRAFWSAVRLTKSLNTVAEPRSPVRLECNCRRHKRGQQPEDCAVGCPATTVIICLCTSCLDSRRGVLTLLVWQTDVMGKKTVLAFTACWWSQILMWVYCSDSLIVDILLLDIMLPDEKLKNDTS